uniref:Uncharacterized protein n=1 Tax=viral metagenome TaxID=1070528 RepID=A0A6C0I5F0_9ZZZZ
MSSLAASASVWTNDNNEIQKRPSTLRKTVKMRSLSPQDGELDEKRTLQTQTPETIHDVQTSNEERNSRVAELLNKITSADNSTSSSRMSDFTPPPKPELQVKKDMAPVQPGPRQMGNGSPISNIVGSPMVNGSSISNPTNTPYSNYTNVYKTKPYYANMGIGATNGAVNGSGGDRVVEKLNYMIHLLEQQQHEQTNFVTEECILYALLGVFVIYVVDSFARSGKYTR